MKKEKAVSPSGVSYQVLDRGSHGAIDQSEAEFRTNVALPDGWTKA